MPTISFTNATGTFTYTEQAPPDPGGGEPPPTTQPPPTARPEPITKGDYYVATNGSDSNDGSEGKPFKTIGKAANVVNPGQIVLVRGGTYSPDKIIIGRHATADKPVVFAPYGEEEAIVDGANGAANEGLVQLNANYTTWQRFTVQNTKHVGIACWASIKAQVLGNKVKATHNAGIWIGGPDANASRDNVVKGNTVTGCVLMNKDHSMGNAGGWGASIAAQQSTNAEIDDNEVYENWGEGLMLNNVGNIKARRNKVRDCYSVNILLDNADVGEVSGNLVAWSGDNKWGYLGGGAPDGIRMTREQNTSFGLTELKVFDNIVINTLTGVSYLNYMAGGGVQNSKIYANTFVNCAPQFDANSNNRDNEFKNNIIVGKNPAGSATGFACDYNCWDKGQGGAFGGAHDVKADPKFTGATGSLEAADYKVATDSPCKQKGVNLHAVVPVDYENTARPTSGAFTIGAYE